MGRGGGGVEAGGRGEGRKGSKRFWCAGPDRRR